MEEITYRGSQPRTVGWIVSDHRVKTGRCDQRTVVIEMLPPSRVLASQEVWPSFEDEMDICKNQGIKCEGTEERSKAQHTTSGWSRVVIPGIIWRHHPSQSTRGSGEAHLPQPCLVSGGARCSTSRSSRPAGAHLSPSCSSRSVDARLSPSCSVH